VTNSVHRLAPEYRNAGISVIPHRLDLDGSKAPSITSWQPYQQRLATDDELSQWFSRPAGVGMVRQQALGQHYPGSSTEHPVVAEFNRRTSWAWILERHGWTSVDGTTWARPGKSSFVKSVGVFTATDGNEVLVVWSGNAGILAPESGDKKTWNKFRAWTALNFHGDSKAAFAAARSEVPV